MEAYEPYLSLGVALGLGLLIGLEREQHAGAEAVRGEQGPGGVRTYPLVALAGAVAAILGRVAGMWLIGLLLAGLIAILALAYADDLRQGRDRGITSEVALVLTYLLGAAALTDGLFTPLSRKLTVVSAIGIAATTLLSFKEPLHGFAQKLSRGDIYSTVKFLIVAVVVLPLLPNRTFGPFDAFNPFTTGVMAVLIATVGFIGYVLVRVLGAGRGLGVTGLIGGLVSSTALTLSMAHQARNEPGALGGCALAIVLACAVMPVRIMVEVFLVNEALLPFVALPMGGMLGGGIATAIFLYFRSRAAKYTAEAVHFTNPFEVWSALKFAALFAAVLVGTKAASEYLGQGGSYLAGVLSGAADVDPITLSMAKLARDGLNARVAATTVLIAAVSNTAVKAGMAVAIGGWPFGRIVVLALGSAAGAGALGALALWLR